ncbi:MAG: PIN/TRAM domain-containing protein [Planctomycetota bacterium]|nr:PIN/TRAM domain-containing protein [Planctomycetota bacterium]
MGLHVIRALFLLIFTGAGWQAGVFLNSTAMIQVFLNASIEPPSLYWCTLAGVGLYLIMLAAEVGFGRVSISVLSSVLFGLLAGFLIANLAYSVVALLLTPAQDDSFGPIIRLSLSCIFCYLGVATVFKTREQFNFVIPYVEFRRDQRGPTPLLLDTSAIVDGRVADLIETRFLDVPILIPRFVLDELQMVADSNDRQKRMRGRRGLDILNRLQNSPRISIQIHEDNEDEDSMAVDSRLVAVAKRQGSRIITTDSPLEKIAQLEGIEVLNMNELANALRPVVIPGEDVQIPLVKPGESDGQAIGYLSDGTMVVVESGIDHIGSEADITISSVLQRDSGRILFGRMKEKVVEKAEERDRRESLR